MSRASSEAATGPIGTLGAISGFWVSSLIAAGDSGANTAGQQSGDQPPASAKESERHRFSLPEHRILRIAAREDVGQQVEHFALTQRVQKILGHQRGWRQGARFDFVFGKLHPPGRILGSVNSVIESLFSPMTRPINCRPDSVWMTVARY